MRRPLGPLLAALTLAPALAFSGTVAAASGPAAAAFGPAAAASGPAAAAPGPTPRPAFGGATTSYVETGRWITGDAPDAVAVDNRGRILVAVDEKIATYTPGGKRLSAFPTGIGSAYGMTVGTDGLIYVSDFGGNRVDVYTSAGELKGSYSDDVNHVAPWGLATHPGTGQIWVANAVGDEILRVNPAAGPIGTFGTGDGEFDTPTDIGAGNGSMYVVDRDNERIQRFNDDTGAFQTQWGQSGFGRGQFNDLAGIDTGLGGVVLVLDHFYSGDSELEAFQPGGGYLNTSAIPASNVQGIATDKAGNVYVSGLISYPRGGWGVVKLSPTGIGKARLAAKRVDAVSGRKKAQVRLACAKGRACTGSVRVLKNGKTLAAGRFSLRAGKRGTTKIGVTARGRKTLKKSARVKVQVVLTSGTGTKRSKATLTR